LFHPASCLRAPSDRGDRHQHGAHHDRVVAAGPLAGEIELRRAR
jgi:hypothetical protein